MDGGIKVLSSIIVILSHTFSYNDEFKGDYEIQSVCDIFEPLKVYYLLLVCLQVVKFMLLGKIKGI